MKKISPAAALILALCLAVGLTACRSPQTAADDGASAQAPAAAPAAAGESRPAASSQGAVEAPRSQRVYSTITETDALRALPYVDGTYDPEGAQRGVTLHLEGRASEGLNFYSSRDLPAAFLVDMDGRFVYQWRGRSGPWQHVDLLPTGEVLALVKDQALIKVGLDSTRLWTFRARVHHDHWRAADGRIYVLSRKSEELPEIHPRHKILADYVTVLSPQGELIEEISLIHLLLDSPFAFLMPSVSHRDWSRSGERPEDVELDLLHANHVELFDGSPGSPLYQKGNALLSFRNVDTIAIADLERRTVVWVWGPSNLVRPHHPALLPGGNLLIFDNRLKASQILELDPRTREVVWSYRDGENFFTASRGSNQRLANGNTLITESDTGYVFEVTPEGEKVWEFANPQVNDQSERSAIWRMVRFAREDLPFLATLERPPPSPAGDDPP